VASGRSWQQIEAGDRAKIEAAFDTFLDELVDAYEAVISKQPGFIGAGLHVNDAQTRIANYSQWEKREDFQAMLRTEEMRVRNRRINALCTGFEPVMYDVAGVFG